MLLWSWIESNSWIWSGGGGASSRWHVGVTVGVTAMAGIALAAAIVISSRRGSLKSPWSRRKRKRALTKEQWKSFFTPEGKLQDGGLKFLKIVRSGGIDPSIRAEVWPFLLGVYELSSTESERSAIRLQKRKEYERLRRRCQRLLKKIYGGKATKGMDEVRNTVTPIFNEGPGSCGSGHVSSSRPSLSNEQETLDNSNSEESQITHFEEDESGITHVCASPVESSDESSSEAGTESVLTSTAEADSEGISTPAHKQRTTEDFATWQRIIRLDAIRANGEWVVYSPVQAAVSEDTALELAASVGLKDYDHFDPSRIYHAARLVAILEAYTLYDPEIGYCQGMSDLLSPIVAVMEEDDEAFWCFVGFMRKARHNFRLDEVGIRRQLNMVSKIIKYGDSNLYRHLEKLQAEDCFFVYRMVVVLFRRELDFEQTLCLWEVMWADQAAIRAGFGESSWARMRLRAPPTDDLLLYAIAACVLQRRKLIVERYRSMDEILRECNNMAGHLDVWKLLDDAHDLVVSLHDKI